MKIKGIKTRRLEFDVSDVFDAQQKWCDKDHLIFVTMMKLNEKFVEDEINADLIDWTWDELHQHAHDEFMAVYKFWKCYDKYVKRIEYQYLYDALIPRWLWFAMEDKIHQLEDQMMRRLIDVRGAMWT